MRCSHVETTTLTWQVIKEPRWRCPNLLSLLMTAESGNLPFRMKSEVNIGILPVICYSEREFSRIQI